MVDVKEQVGTGDDLKNLKESLITFLEQLLFELKNGDIDNTKTFLLNEFMARYNEETISNDGKEILEFINLGYYMYKNLFDSMS